MQSSVFSVRADLILIPIPLHLLIVLPLLWVWLFHFQMVSVLSFTKLGYDLPAVYIQELIPMRIQETDTKPFRAICESVGFEFKEIENVAGKWGFVHLFASKKGQKTFHDFVGSFCPTIPYSA